MRTVLVVGSGVVLAAFLGCMFASTPELKRLFDNIHWTAAYGSAAILAWLGWRRADESHRKQHFYFALGLSSYTVGQLLWDIQVATNWNPFPGPSDLFFLMCPGFITLGLWDSVRLSDRGNRKFAVLIDAALMIAAMLVVTLTIYLPLQGKTPLLEFMVLTAYPVIFICTVVLGLLTVVYRRPRWSLGWVALLLASGLNVWLWMQWNAMTLDGSLSDGTVYNGAFSVVALLCGVGAYYWRIDSSDSRRFQRIAQSSIAFFPLIAVIAASTAIVISYALPGLEESVRTTIEIGSFVIVMLGVVGQSLLVHDLQVSKDRLELAAEASADGIWDWNVLTDEVVFSDGYRRMMGLSIEEFPNDSSSFFSRLHPDDVPRVRQAHHDHLVNRLPYSIEYRLRMTNGEYRWFRSKGQAIWESNGKASRMAGSITDITSQKIAEMQLQEQRALGELIRRVQESFIRDSDPKEALSALLPGILETTDSEYGFIGEILYENSDTPYLKAYALTDISWSDAIKEFYERNAPNGLEFRDLDNLFGYSIQTGSVVISNEPSSDPRSGGLPNGHPALTAFVGIPLMSGNEMVGQLGLANRPGGYSAEFLDVIQPLVQTLGSIIAAWQTDRRRAEAEEDLRWLNAAFAAGERIAKMGHWVRDLETNESVWSDSMYQLLGIPIGTPAGIELATEHIAPEYRELLHDAVAKARIDGTPWDHEIELIDGNGRRFWVRGIAEPIYRDGKLVGLQGILQDIEDQKQTENELQLLNKRLKSAERLAKMGHWHNDLVRGEMYWSDTMYELAGIDKSLPASDLTGQSIVAPEYFGEFIRLAILGREEGIPWDYEFEIVRGDGKRIWVRAIANPLVVDGKVVAVQGILQDIDQEKQVALALAKSRESYELALHGAELGTWDWDVSSGQVIINNRWAEMVGYTTHEIGLALDELEVLTHPSDIDFVREAMQAHLRGDTHSYEVEHRLRHKDGHWIWVLDKGRVCEWDKDGKPLRMSGTHLDITRRKEAEQQIREMNTILEQRVQERTAELRAANAELESFAYSVSHDLRSPLRALDGFAKLLGDDLEGRATDHEMHYLKRIRAAAQRMAAIIDSLLTLSRTTRSHLAIKKVDLSAAAQHIASDLAISDPKRKVQWHIQDGLVTSADPQLMRNLLENLLGNAWKYSSKKEVANIEFGLYESTDDQDVYFVKDNGAGFDMAYVDRIFKPFQRLHRVDEFEGTGVGLATVYRILQRHGGEIKAVGTVGKGATMFFSIPRR